MLSLSLLQSCCHILQENIIRLIASIHLSLQYMQIYIIIYIHSLLFLIKKHNNHKTAGYNDKAYIIY